MLRCDVAIVGAGLCGLRTASLLHARGVDCLVIEARDRIGGRILSKTPDGVAFSPQDMGPAWFWPDVQPLMREVVADLGLVAFPQSVDGDVLVERFRHEAPRRYASGAQPASRSMRLAGGMAALTDALAATLPANCLHLGTRVSTISPDTNAGVRIGIEGPNGDQPLLARHVVLAIPPRLVVRDIRFEPELAPVVATALAGIPTWMAGQAKTMIVYAERFWADLALSGTAISFVGPLGEIHDSTPLAGTPALFGFVGLPAATRAAMGVDRLHKAALLQLVRLFGSRAATPLAMITTDWALESLTATEADALSAIGHERTLNPNSSPHWQRCVTLAGSELAPDYPGYLEGALSSAQSAAASIIYV